MTSPAPSAVQTAEEHEMRLAAHLVLYDKAEAWLREAQLKGDDEAVRKAGRHCVMSWLNLTSEEKERWREYIRTRAASAAGRARR